MLFPKNCFYLTFSHLELGLNGTIGQLPTPAVMIKSMIQISGIVGLVTFVPLRL